MRYRNEGDVVDDAKTDMVNACWTRISLADSVPRDQDKSKWTQRMAAVKSKFGFGGRMSIEERHSEMSKAVSRSCGPESL